MYIIFETLSSNDPRWHSNIKDAGKFWHHTIGYIAPEDEESTPTQWITHEVIDEGVAKASLFASAYKGELSVLADENGNVWDNTITPTSGGDAHFKKATYFLTADDKSNAIKCMQAAMRLFTQQHSTDAEKNAELIEQINALPLTDLDDAQMFMATYFDFDTAYTNGKPRSPLITMNWIW